MYPSVEHPKSMSTVNGSVTSQESFGLQARKYSSFNRILCEKNAKKKNIKKQSAKE